MTPVTFFRLAFPEESGKSIKRLMKQDALKINNILVKESDRIIFVEENKIIHARHTSNDENGDPVFSFGAFEGFLVETV